MNLITLTATKLPNGAVRITNPDGAVKLTIPADHSSKPDRRYKYITLNCYRWRLEWAQANAN